MILLFLKKLRLLKLTYKVGENMIKNYILTFILSMIPIIELRGSIPFGTVICNPPIPIFYAYVISIIGNIIPMPFVYLFAKRILNWGKNISGICSFILLKGNLAGSKLIKSSKNSIFIALLLFVGIPLPGTGAWTGTLAATVLNLDFKKSILSISLGVILSGIIISILSFIGVNVV